MLMRRNATRFIGGFGNVRAHRWLILILVPGLLCTGCFDQGILLTPVSTNRELVESELLRESFFAADKIALVDVSGTISNSETGGLFGGGEIPTSLLLEQLHMARRDSSVKAVLLRINSPGGTVTASELMHDEIRAFRKQTGKPVVAVMMDVAASGGYYIACACDEIVAQPSTITGSIGVIMQSFELSGTLGKLGITTDAITSGPKKDAGSPFRVMTDEERALFQAIIDDMYGRFVDVVVQGRPALDEADVRRIADGRVYTAGQALELGLIDRVATLRQVIGSMKKRIGASKVRVVAYRRPLGYKPNYYAGAPDPQPTNVNLINVNLPDWLANPAPRFMYLWQPGTWSPN